MASPHHMIFEIFIDRYRIHMVFKGPDNPFIKWVTLTCPDIPNSPHMSWLWLLIFSLLLYFCSHRWFVDGSSSSPDSVQGWRRHTTAYLRGVSDHTAAHSLISGVVPAVPRGRGRTPSGAGHLVKGLCSALWGTVPAEDGGRGPQAG